MLDRADHNGGHDGNAVKVAFWIVLIWGLIVFVPGKLLESEPRPMPNIAPAEQTHKSPLDRGFDGQLIGPPQGLGYTYP